MPPEPHSHRALRLSLSLDNPRPTLAQTREGAEAPHAASLERGAVLPGVGHAGREAWPGEKSLRAE